MIIKYQILKKMIMNIINKDYLNNYKLQLKYIWVL